MISGNPKDNTRLWISKLRPLKNTANAAKDSAESLPKIERAHIFISVEFKKPEMFYDDIHGFQGLYQISSNIKVCNYGKTPADIKIIQGKISLVNPYIPRFEEYHISSGFALGADGENRYNIINSISETVNKGRTNRYDY